MGALKHPEHHATGYVSNENFPIIILYKNTGACVCVGGGGGGRAPPPPPPPPPLYAFIEVSKIIEDTSSLGQNQNMTVI